MMEFLNKLPPATLEVAGLVMGMIVTVAGWAFVSHRQRVLMRRQAAIDLLSQNRFQPEFVNAGKLVWAKVTSDTNYNWRQLMIARTENSLSGADKILCDSLLVILNHLEFLAIAVLNKAADEKLIKWSQGYFFKTVNTGILGFILQARKDRNDEEIFCNLTKLADRWKKKTDVATPTDGIWASVRSVFRRH